MTALAAPRGETTERMTGWSSIWHFRGADSVAFFAGGIVCIDSVDGRLKKGAPSTTLKAIGRCEESIVLTAANTRSIRCKTGIFKYASGLAADAITVNDIGAECFIIDDQTVGKTDGTATRSKAGIVADIDPDGGIWVAFRFPLSVS